MYVAVYIYIPYIHMCVCAHIIIYNNIDLET